MIWQRREYRVKMDREGVPANRKVVAIVPHLSSQVEAREATAGRNEHMAVDTCRAHLFADHIHACNTLAA